MIQLELTPEEAAAIKGAIDALLRAQGYQALGAAFGVAAKLEQAEQAAAQKPVQSVAKDHD